MMNNNNCSNTFSKQSQQKSTLLTFAGFTLLGSEKC